MSTTFMNGEYVVFIPFFSKHAYDFGCYHDLQNEATSDCILSSVDIQRRSHFLTVCVTNFHPDTKLIVCQRAWHES